MTRILVVTVAAWCQRSGTNTFSSLFELIRDKDIEVANIYTRADIPDSPMGDKYFQVSENKVLKSILTPRIKTGKIVNRKNDNDLCNKELIVELQRYSKYSKRRNPLLLVGREMLWKIGKWRSKELDDFLDEFAPDIIFIPIQGYIFINRLSAYVINRCQTKKVIGFLWDDNFTYKQEKSVSYYIGRYFVRKSVKKLVNICDMMLAICPKMKEECDRYFGTNSVILTKPMRLGRKSEYNFISNKVIRMIYTGGLGYGRVQTLTNVVQALKKINASEIHIFLDIYTTSSLNDKYLRLFNDPTCCSLKGGIPQSQVFKEQEKSDMLLLIESFTNKIARLSLSTKLTDYFSSNRCIFAIGPSDIASMEYLRQEDAALICNSSDEIFKTLKRVIESPHILSEYAKKGYDCGLKNHSASIIREKLCSILDLN